MLMTSEMVDDLVKDDRVHVSIYTDEGIFDEEMRRIFYTSWVYLGHESEVRHTGDYKTTYIGLVPVILSRHEDGQLYVLVNRCMHRGTTVCQRERGNSNFFRCQYHAWTFGNDGSLTGVGGRRGYAPGEIVDSELTLRRAPRVDTYRGFVFASLAPTGPSLSDHLGLAKRYIDDFVDKSPTGEVDLVGGVYKHTYIGNWKLQLEGSNEGYHADFLHRVARFARERTIKVPQGQGGRNASGGTGLGFNASKDGRGIDLGNGHSLMDSPNRTASTWEELEERFPKDYLDSLVARLGKDRTLEVLSRGWRMQLFPNAAFSSDHQIRVMRPLSVGETEIRQYNVLVPEVSAKLTLGRIRSHESFYGPAGFGGPDDLEIFARMHEGYKAGAMFEGAEWALFNRGYTTETRGEKGEKIAHVATEIEQRAIYYAWRALMKGESNVTITG